MISYRILPPEEYGRLAPVMNAFGGIIPIPESSRIPIAENEQGELVGFFVTQLLPHFEPAWVQPSRETRGVYDELLKMAMESLAGAPQGTAMFAIADSRAAARRCEEMGMRLVDQPVYVKYKESIP